MQPSIHTQTFQNERIVAAGLAINKEFVKVKLQPDLFNHRVYVYTELVVNSGQDFRFSGQLIFRHNNSPVSVLPINLAQDVAGTNLKQSLVNSFANQNSVPDSIYVYLSSKFVAVGAILSPQRVSCPADDVVFDLQEVWATGDNLVGARMLVIVRSTDTEF